MKDINTPANSPQKKKTARKFKKWSFEYWYMIIMIVYMAQMTNDTSRMIGQLSGDPIPFVIPIIFTVILLYRNKIEWKDKRLIIALSVATFWSVLQIIKQRDYSIGFLSYTFFFWYAIIIAYIHVRVYGIKLLVLYEDIVVKFSVIAIILWVISVTIDDIFLFFRQFPETAYGYNFLYVFNFMKPGNEQYYHGIMRNAGFSWEPGRFAIMLCLALLCNLFRKGISFKKNNNVIILLIALATTQSTTGFSLCLILYTIFLIKRISFKQVMRLCIIIIPILWGIMQLDFMWQKIEEKMDVTNYLEGFEIAADYNSTSGLEEHVSLDRFVSMYFESLNIMEDPILGYSRDFSKSLFAKNYIEDYSLTGGLVSVFGRYGIIFGIVIYFCLLYSSTRISRQVPNRRRFAIFIYFIVASVSYPLFCIPVFTSFWLYGLFEIKPHSHHSKTRNSVLKQKKV